MKAGLAGIVCQVKVPVQVAVLDVRAAQCQPQSGGDEKRRLVQAADHGGQPGGAGDGVNLASAAQTTTGRQPDAHPTCSTLSGDFQRRRRPHQAFIGQDGNGAVLGHLSQGIEVPCRGGLLQHLQPVLQGAGNIEGLLNGVALIGIQAQGQCG